MEIVIEGNGDYYTVSLYKDYEYTWMFDDAHLQHAKERAFTLNPDAPIVVTGQLTARDCNGPQLPKLYKIVVHQSIVTESVYYVSAWNEDQVDDWVMMHERDPYEGNILFSDESVEEIKQINGPAPKGETIYQIYS